MQLPLQIFNYTVQNQSSDTVDVHVDGDIVDSPTKELLENFWGDQTSTSFKSFRDKVPAGVKTVNVFVNSPGGHCGDALAIHDYLKSLEAKGVKVNRLGRGIIASAGTYILMGKDSEMSANSYLMIHNVSGTCSGTVDQVENQVKAMRKFNDQIVNFYVNQTGLSKSEITGFMNQEKWFTAKEAKEKGFVKNVAGEAVFKNSIKADRWQFTNKAVLNAYNAAVRVSKTKAKNRFSGAYEPERASNDVTQNTGKTQPKTRFSGHYKPAEEKAKPGAADTKKKNTKNRFSGKYRPLE